MRPWELKKAAGCCFLESFSTRKETYDNQLPEPYPRNPRLQIQKDGTNSRYRDLLSAFDSQASWPARSAGLGRHPASKLDEHATSGAFASVLKNADARRIRCRECGAASHEPVHFCPDPYVRYTKKRRGRFYEMMFLVLV